MGDNATVTVHIKKIRKKIEKDTANPKYIQTVWGTGVSGLRGRKGLFDSPFLYTFKSKVSLYKKFILLS